MLLPAIAVLGLVLVAVGVVLLRPAPTALDRSIEDLRTNASFASSPKAAQALARVSERLFEDGRRCARSHPEGDKGRYRCNRRLAAAGWSSVAARVTLTCTQPGTQQLRQDFLSYLREVRRVDGDPQSPAPLLPDIPNC